MNANDNDISECYLKDERESTAKLNTNKIDFTNCANALSCS